VLKVCQTYFIIVDKIKYAARKAQNELYAALAASELMVFIISAYFADGASIGIMFVTVVKFKSIDGATLPIGYR
jgi:hypothetical protein